MPMPGLPISTQRVLMAMSSHCCPDFSEYVTVTSLEPAFIFATMLATQGPLCCVWKLTTDAVDFWYVS